jgi:hypothetical protein
VIVNSTSVSGASYPPHAVGIGRSCLATGTSNIGVNGMTFQSYLENIAATGGGNLGINTCNFTAPTSGHPAPISAYAAGVLSLAGNCQYTGATAAPYIFGCTNGATISLGLYDGITEITFAFNIAGTPVLTTCTAIASSGGCIVVYNVAVSFSGGVPACPQYIAQTGGGIVFQNGVTTAFPGTLPGQVTSPGWTD